MMKKVDTCKSIESASATCSSTSVQKTQLAAAIKSANLNLIKQILERKSKDSDLVNCPLGPLAVTPLHLASAKSRSESMISILVQQGAEVSTTDKIGRSALYYAATRGDDSVVELLIASGANVDSRFQARSSELEADKTARHSGESPPKELIPGYEDLMLPDCLGRTPLHQAVKGGHVSCVDKLLQKGADPNAEDEKGLTPLLLAGAGGLIRYQAIVDLLVFYGAEVNKINPLINTSPLYHAVALRSVIGTQILLNAGAALAPPCQNTSPFETVLHVAASSGCLAVTQLLLNHGAIRLVNSCNNVGCTPLHKAAYAGSRDCLRLLLNSGGDLSLCTDSGLTVVDVIMSYLPRPINFLQDCLNYRVTANPCSINDRDFKITLDFSILSPRGCTNQMCVVSALSAIPKLLQHPLVEAFVLEKWAKLRYFFFIYVFLYVSFVTSLSTYVIFWTKNEQTITLRVVTARVVLLVSSSLLLLHTALELVLMGRQRLRQGETWLTLINALLALFIGVREPSAGECEIPSNIRHIASFTILLGWACFMSVIGRFPILGYYILMFAVVLQNVIKVFVTFICLVIGFALSFEVQFPQEEQFSNLWHSLVRTTVMMMGEYDYNDLFKDNQTDGGQVGGGGKGAARALVPTSRIIFLMFVLLASVALMNLMVGLAVNDIQGLKTEGNIRRLQKQTDFVLNLERILAHHIIQKVRCGHCRGITRHHIPSSVPLQPSSAAAYHVLPTSLLETLINLALQNRSKSQSSSNQVGDESSTKDRIKYSELLLKRGSRSANRGNKSFLTLPNAGDVRMMDDIAQLKELLLQVLATMNASGGMGLMPEDVPDGGQRRAPDDNAISVNAMLRRVSSPRHSVGHQVFSH